MKSNKKSKIWLMPKEEFQEIISSCTSLSDVLVKMGFRPSSGSMKTMLRKRIEEDNIDDSSIIKNVNQYGLKHKTSDILVENSEYKSRYHLKNRLVKEGLLDYKCASCENDGYWNGKKLTLQLEHKNGIPNDNRLSNLEFLCPNCHSQTDTYSGKNRKVE